MAEQPYSWWVECQELNITRRFGLAPTLEDAQRPRDEQIRVIESRLKESPSAHWSAGIKQLDQEMADEGRSGPE